MSGAFFVGKRELLSWANEMFQLDLQKVEDAADGVMYVMLCDALGWSVPLHRLHWPPVHSVPDRVSNWKLVQRAFDQQGIKKHIPIEALVKGKPLDNLEFFQWAKHLFSSRHDGQEYDAVARREAAMKRAGKGKSRRGRPGRGRPTGGASRGARRGRGAASGGARAAPRGGARGSRGASGGSSHAKEDLAKIDELNEKLSKLRLTIEGLEKERNFYFGKLREIEVLCQEDEEVDSDTKTKVLEILYATDDDEFQAPEDEEEPAPEDDYHEEEEEEYVGDEDEDLTF